MQKTLIAILTLSLGLISNSQAACDLTPYNAPEDLQLPCSNDTVSPVSDADKDHELGAEKKDKASTAAPSETDPSHLDKSNKPSPQTNAQ